MQKNWKIGDGSNIASMTNEMLGDKKLTLHSFEIVLNIFNSIWEKCAANCDGIILINTSIWKDKSDERDSGNSVNESQAET